MLRVEDQPLAGDVFLAFVRSQVAQVLLTLPYSFSQLGMVSGVLLQIFYGLMGSWTAYLISVLYVEYRARKEKEGVSFKNHVIQVGRSSRRLGLPLPPRPPSTRSRTPHSTRPSPQPFQTFSFVSPASPAHGFCAAFARVGWGELDPLAMVGHALTPCDR